MVDRRAFIKKTSLTTASVGMAPLTDIWGNRKASEKPINVGIIGTGSRGSWILKLLGENDLFRVIACCDIIPFRLAGGMKLADPKAKGLSDYRRLIEEKDLEAVIIATPLSEHFTMAMDALDAGKHVYCEKTMTYSTEQSEKLKSKAIDTDVIFQVGYQHRYNPIYHEIKYLLYAGYCGEITHVFCNWNRNSDWRRKVENPEHERIVNWRMYREYSGGLMAELCSHQIDLVNWLTEQNPVEVTGTGGIDYWEDGRETFDNVMTIYKYPDGMKASFNALTTNSQIGYHMRIMGTKGTIEVTGANGHRAKIFAEQPDEKVDGVTAATTIAWEAGDGIPIKVENPAVDDRIPTGRAFQDFASCIRTGGKPVSNIGNGYSSSLCVHAGNKAMRDKSQIGIQY